MSRFNQGYIEERDYFEKMRDEVEPLWSRGDSGFFLGAKGRAIRFYVIGPVKPRATLVVVPGTSESFIKYKEFCFDAVRFGFRVFLMDHRGHGFSERVVPHVSDVVHVDQFAYYVEDLASFVANVVKPKQVGRLLLFGHSLGGLIAVSLLAQDSALVDAAVFSSPMLAIKAAGIPCGLLRVMVAPFVYFGSGARYSFGQHPASGKRDFSKAGTRSRVRFEYYYKQIKSQESLLLMGGVSHAWLYECLGAIAALKSRQAQITTKIRVIAAGDDKFVGLDAERRFVKHAANAEMVLFEDAAHEAWNDRDQVRKRAMKAIFDFFEMQLG